MPAKNKTKIVTTLAIGLTVIAAALLIRPAQVHAASPTGISIGPFEEAINIAPTDTQKSFELQLSNYTKTVQELDLTTQDFGSLNDSGGIVLEGSNTYTQKYGLTSWLSLETNSVVLRPNETRQVLVTIDNRQDLQPGGHYGAIIASVVGDASQSANHVQINQQLTSLVLVDKQGGDRYDLALTSINQNGNWLHLPDDVRLEFQNPGNVHIIPRGVVQLRNNAGTVVAQGIINSQSAFILPESYRQLSVPLMPTGQGDIVPGKYSVVVQYRYDGLNSYATKAIGVRFIDLKLYVILILLVVGFAWLLRVSRRRLDQPSETPKKPTK
jgi:hypothetical protein